MPCSPDLEGVCLVLVAPASSSFQVEGLGVEEAVEAVRQARPHIKLYKKHYEVLRRFHSDKQIKSKS